MSVPVSETPALPVSVGAGVSAPRSRATAASKPREAIWLIAGVALAAGLVGLFATIGADARWLAALGHYVVASGRIPTGVPFATASSAHWSNTLVLAELVFHGLEAGWGDRGLALANLVAVTTGLSILALDARAAGARGSTIAGTLVLVVIAAFPTLAIVRVQMFSLILFPALIALLRADARNPSARIWWALPLLALWSNLHGAALSGLAVLWAYVLLFRVRRDPVLSAAILLGSLVAMCLTPAGLGTVSYYHGLLTNVAAQRGVGQWAPVGQSPFDWVMVMVVLLLAIRLRHEMPRIWEAAVLIGLAALTVKAARDGVWLLFFLLTPATRGRARSFGWDGMAPALLLLGLVLMVFDLARPPHPSGASQRMVAKAVRLSAGSPILADGLPGEQIAMAGGTVWAGNPLDAFTRQVQGQYVDFLRGEAGGRVALTAPGVRYVLVTRGSAAASLVGRDSAYALVASDASAILYRSRR